MPASSIRPYMWIVSGPAWTIPVCGEGMDASTAPILPQRALEQDAERELGRAALRDEIDREVEIDLGPPREHLRLRRVVAGARELLDAPALDPLALGLDRDFEICHRHQPSLRSCPPRGSPPGGVSHRCRRSASRSACAFVRSPSSRTVSAPRCQMR